MIIVYCPRCNKKIKTPADLIGKHIRCPQCDYRVLVEVSFDEGDDEPNDGIVSLSAEDYSSVTNVSGRSSDSRLPEWKGKLAQMMLVVIGAVVLLTVASSFLSDKDVAEGAPREENQSVTKETSAYIPEIEASWFVIDNNVLAADERYGFHSYAIILKKPFEWMAGSRPHLKLSLADGSTYKPAHFATVEQYGLNDVIPELNNLQLRSLGVHIKDCRVKAVVFQIPRVLGAATFHFSGHETPISLSMETKSSTNTFLNNSDNFKISQIGLPGQILARSYAPETGDLVFRCQGSNALHVYRSQTQVIDSISLPDQQSLFGVFKDKAVIYEPVKNTFKILSLSNLEVLRSFPSPVDFELQSMAVGAMNECQLFGACLLKRGRFTQIYYCMIDLKSGQLLNTMMDFPILSTIEESEEVSFRADYAYEADPSLSRIVEVVRGKGHYLIKRNEHGIWHRKPIQKHYMSSIDVEYVPTLNGYCSVLGSELYNDLKQKTAYQYDAIVPSINDPRMLAISFDKKMHILDPSGKKVVGLSDLPDEAIMKHGQFVRKKEVVPGLNRERFVLSKQSVSYAAIQRCSQRLILDSLHERLLVLPKVDNVLIQMDYKVGEKRNPILQIPAQAVARCVPGTSFRQQLYACGADGVTFEIEHGPDGLFVSPNGVLTWPVPDSFNEDEELLVMVSAGPQNQVYHKLTLKPAEPAGKPSDWKEVPDNLVQKVNGLVVMEISGGEYLGEKVDVIMVANKSETVDAYKIKFARGKKIGESMKESLLEVRRLIENRGMVELKNFDIEVSFGDKYVGKDGGSASVAFAVLLHALAENAKLDPKVAMTGDLTVEGKVRVIGGVAAKLRGAIRAGCTVAIIPEENAVDIMDMGLLNSEETLKKINVLAIQDISEALDICKMEKRKAIRDAHEDYLKIMRPYIGRDVVPGDQGLIKERLAKVLKACPNHVSAQYFYNKIQNSLPKLISSAQSYRQMALLIDKYDDELLDAKRNSYNRSAIFTTQQYKKSVDRCALLKKVTDEQFHPVVDKLEVWIKDAHSYARSVKSADKYKGTSKAGSYKKRVAKTAQTLEVSGDELAKALNELGTNIELLEDMLK